MRFVSTLIQLTNLILLLNNTSFDRRKFIVWDIESDKPQEILSGLQISRVQLDNQKKLFEHPIETGGVIVDYEIFEPKKATLQAYISLDDAATYTELEQCYKNGTILRIRAENRIINNVVIASQPFELTGKIFDKTLYSISLKQAYFVIPQYTQMADAKKKSNVSRVNSGIKQAEKTEKKPKPKSWILSAITGGRT